MSDTDVDKARAILDKTMYSTIATTAEDGTPWAAPVFTVYDPKAKTLYWCAARDSQHGQNIRRSGKACIAVYDSMAAPGEGSGVYLQCSAAEVTAPEAIAAAHAKLIAKHQPSPYWGIDDLQPSSPVALFEARVASAWVNRDRMQDGHFVLYRESISL